MIRGTYARVLLADDGRLISLATGSDATTEHEGGYEPLLRKLCHQHRNEAQVLQDLREGKAVTYPSLLEQKRIVKFPPDLKIQGAQAGGVAEAILSAGCQDPLVYASELTLYKHANIGDPDVAGAWCESAFALRVRGRRYVAALEGFYRQILAGRVFFGGRFFSREHFNPSGVVLVDGGFLNEDDRSILKEEQARYESSLRLRVRDDSRELMREMAALRGDRNGSFPGFIWAQWRDSNESEVVYGLNPDLQTKADRFGRYTRQELLEWARAKGGFHLRPQATLGR